LSFSSEVTLHKSEHSKGENLTETISGRIDFPLRMSGEIAIQYGEVKRGWLLAEVFLAEMYLHAIAIEFQPETRCTSIR
jgi:hypothetical protein